MDCWTTIQTAQANIKTCKLSYFMIYTHFVPFLAFILLLCSVTLKRKNKVPREELHTCHIKKKKKKGKDETLSSPSSTTSLNKSKPIEIKGAVNSNSANNLLNPAMASEADMAAISFNDAPDLPNYFNNLDEINRLQFAKERWQK